ncbi:MAG: hypothetical protein M3388_09660 [Acidobacteriota bacterium]|nr:hypothetical protein [Acidobacteriota bacterium]
MSGVYVVMPAATQRLNLEEEFKDTKSAKSAGFSGASTTRLGKVAQVKIGNIFVNSPSVVFWEKGTGHDTTFNGFTIGNGFLKDFVVDIDYRNNVITLEKQGA